MKMILIRHGESEANAKGIYQGHKDYSLSERGKTQAFNLSQRLKEIGYNIELIYSSDLSRASQTAKIIGETLQLKKIVYTSLLREMDLGIYSGKLELKERDTLSEFWKEYTRVIPGGESVNMFVSRIKEFMNLIKKLNNKPSVMLVITHGGVLYHLLHTILNVFPETDEWFGNCMINELEVSSKWTWKLKTFNEELV
jgi:broad specificity phosphatase PhoE